MIRLLLYGLLAYIGYRFFVSLLSSPKRPTVQKQGAKDGAAATHLDPVCGIYVSEDDAIIGRLDGKRHYFCSHECLEKFRETLEHTQ